MPTFAEDHPNGKTLMARDSPQNRKLFPDGPFGYLDVADSICDGTVCPHYHYKEDLERVSSLQTPIHMLIAAFRDKLCSRTIHNAFTKAENPKRIWIRIIDQTEPNSPLVDDQGCWPRYCSEYNPNCEEYKRQVHSVRVDAALSRGPTWARAKLSAMIHWDYVHRNGGDELELTPVQPQDFCMQIDSHMDFSDNYDTGLIAMFHRTENDYAVLSTYVTDIEHNNKDDIVGPNLCMVTFTSSIRNWATKECRGLVRPKLTNAMWGAGLSFHRCHAELNVPVDPYLDNVFDGEEGSRGIRFFTHGYDVYAPDKVLVTHDYHGHQSNPIVHTWGRGSKQTNHQEEKEPEREMQVIMEDHWKWNQDIEDARPRWYTFGSKRVNMVLGIGSTFNGTEREANERDLIRSSRFGLGTKRTLEQVREFTGINLLEKYMEVNKCGNLIWVPFAESLGYGVDETLARGYAGEVVVVAANKAAESSPSVPRLRALPETPSLNASNDSSNYRVAGGLIVVALVIARWSIHKIGRKDERHKY
jgi:hypothetical protein